MSDDPVEQFLDDLYPYRNETETFRQIPETGRPARDVLAEVRSFARREDAMGDEGRVSGSLYSGDHAHYAVLAEVFEEFAHVNVLQRDMYPSATKFEAEVIAMVADMLHGRQDGVDACGVLTSGGSESLITALYAYREWAAAERGISRPNIVMPRTAHVALDKGAHWLGIEVRHAPLTDGYVADVQSMGDLMDDNTIALVGSAANYAHGLIDPIEDLGRLASERGVGLHVDGCLGGFILPWIEENGIDMPLWDYRVPGVTSISADTHKYGYALKGTSVLTYRSKELRAHQWFAYPDWPGGLYVSPGFAGSRSGGLIASTWASLVLTGREGYLAAARDIYSAAQRIVRGIREIPQLQVIGEPTFLVAFGSEELDIYLVNDELKRRGWRMNALQLPPALHFCVTRPNTPDAVVDAFLADLRASVDFAAANAGTASESGALYGFSGSIDGNATITTLMAGYLDALHDPAP